MKTTSMFGITTLLMAGALPAAAQSPKVSGLVQVWYNQVLDNNLRLNSAATPTYYNLRSEFKENGFTIRRVELKFAGTITDDVEYEAMVDPSINNNGNDKNILLQDAAIKYKLSDTFEFRVGQFKNLQTLEGLTSSSELLFVERSQLGRVFGDDRQRGGVLSLGFGDKAFGGKAHVALFNGNGKANESQGNAMKDVVVRVDFRVGSTLQFGAYTLQGSTDQPDTRGIAVVAPPPAGWPSVTDIYANKDKTSNLGAYFQYLDGTWYVSAEAITGLLGRRFPAFASYKREHVDQKYMGYALTGGYTSGHHTFLLRYDTMNYNSGNQWHAATNPYVRANGDYTPKFTETTLGYLYAFKPEKLKAANIKINFVNRSKNFLAPRPGQDQAQGGNTLVAAFQVAF